MLRSEEAASRRVDIFTNVGPADEHSCGTRRADDYPAQIRANETTGNPFSGSAFPVPALTSDGSKACRWEPSVAPGPRAASASRQLKLKTLKSSSSHTRVERRGSRCARGKMQSTTGD